MALSTVELGLGTTLSYDTAVVAESYGGASWTAIAEIEEVNAPGATAGEEEVTHMESATKEYIAQLTDTNEISGTIHFLPSTYSALMTLVGTRPNHAWQITTDDATGTVDGTYQFLGFLKSFEPQGFTAEGHRTATFSIRRSSAVTITLP
ncbi:MAG: hypothetical protein DHS20C16_03550 [Phycisphaerae bacterium]|nr:MAG: hypothetical protein DHS20C16_03550 [Phycisphaerae bacterium]